MHSDLKFKVQGDRVGGVKCPHCGCAVTPEAVVCVQCGWNLREGRMVDAQGGMWRPRPRKKTIKIPVGPLLVLVAVAVAARWGWRRYQDDSARVPADTAANTLVFKAPVETQQTAAVVAPLPEFDSEEEIVAVAELFLPTVTKDVDETHPRIRAQSAAELRKINGQVISGTITSMTESNIVVTAAVATQVIAYVHLDAMDRLRCDAGYRESWELIQARSNARKQLQDQGRKFPPFAGGTREEDIAAAADLGQPDALCAYGTLCSADSPDADWGWAYMCFSAAAIQNHAESCYRLARMYVDGKGIPRDTAEGFKWMELAAELHYAPAESFVSQYEKSRVAYSQALAAYRTQRQAVNQDYANRLQTLSAQAAQPAGGGSGLPPAAPSGFAITQSRSRSLAQMARDRGQTVYGVDGSGRQFYYGPGGKHTIVGRRKN